MAMRATAPLALVVFAMSWMATPALAQAPVAPPPDQAAAAQALRAEVERLRQEFDAVRQQYGDRLAALEARLAAMDTARAPSAPVSPATPPAATPPAAVPAVPSPPPPAPPGGVAQAPAGAETPAAAAGAAAGQGVEVPAGAAGAGGPQGSLPVYGNASALSKVFNPDIAVIGNFLGSAGHNDVAPSPSFEMREAEVSYQAIVDPYARADFFIGVGGDGSIDIEEGFLTLTSLPGGFLAKVGKMYSAFGKVNQMHSHILPWTDRPLMNVNLVGGGENVNDAGFSVSRLIPNPWLFLEATGEVYRGESALFTADTPSHLSYTAHVRAYRDIGESTNLDLGTSFAYGHNDALEVNGTTRLVGIDATFRYRPLRRAIYKRLLARTEMTWSRRSELGSVPQSFGAYVSGEYQFARRWFSGVRFDYADRATSSNVTDKGGSILLTYWPSEFSQIRGQYRRTRYGDAPSVANEFLFQFLFSIGAHGAHAF
jgi:hypothetical protein